MLGVRGCHSLLPFGRVGSTTASASQAATDASEICAAIVDAIGGSAYGGTYTLTWPDAISGSPTLPSSGSKVYVYLDIEASAGLTSAYWNSFAETMYNYGVGTVIGGHPQTVYPFRAAAYVDPCNSEYCPILNAYPYSGSEPQYACWAIWTSVKQCFGVNCHNPFPTWSPGDCSECGPVNCPNLRTFGWQFASPGSCSNLSGTAGQVDFDATHSIYDALGVMLVCNG